MIKQLIAGVLVVQLATSVHALTEHSWWSTYHEGVITNAAYWKNGNGWMDSTDDYARLWQSSEGEYRFLLPTTEVNPAYLAFYQMANSTVTLDGADAVFSAPAVPNGQADRQSNPSALTFYWKSGNYQAFTLSSARNYLYDLSNVLWRVKTTFPGPADSTSPDVAMDFARGLFNFAGRDGTDKSIALTMNGNADVLLCPRSMSATVTNAQMVAPTFKWAGHATNTCLKIGQDGVVKVVGNFEFGTSGDVSTCGTNTLVVTDGGALAGSPSGVDAYDNVYTFGGTTVGLSRWNEVLVSDPASRVDWGDVNSIAFNGPTRLAIANGASVTLPRAVDIKPGVGKRSELTIDGADTVVTLSKKRADGTCGYLTTGKGTVEINVKGGVLKGEGADGEETMQLNLASDSDSTCVFNQSGGTVLHRPTVAQTPLKIGGTGSCAYNLSGGQLLVGTSGIRLGAGTPSKAQECSFSMTGGLVDNAADLVIDAANAYWTHYLRLNGGLYRGLRVRGGSGDFPAKLYFEGDGGVFRAIARAVDETYPFFYGFSEAKIGARGFTFDTNGFQLRIRQAFADKAGENGVLRFVGSGRVLMNGSGVETTVSTISLSQTEVYPQSDLDGLSSTLVVTNAATLNLSSCKDGVFSLGGLVLGDIRTAGTLVLTPTNQLMLGTFASSKGILNLVGPFEAETAYPVATVAGRLSDAGAAGWAQISVNGNVPANRVAVTTSSYDQMTDTTTLVLSFAEAQEPSVANGWQGMSGETTATWDDPASWSAGVPDLASIATFGSVESAVSARVEVNSQAALVGALAFTADRDYVLTGLGSLYLADTGYDAYVNVAAGHQTIGVPVTATRNLDVNVAAGATLAFEAPIQVKAGILRVNPDLTTGGVLLSGANSSATGGIYFRGGQLTVSSTAVFDGFAQKSLFDFHGYATLRVCGDPADAEYRLPFDLYMRSINWGSPEAIWTDCPLVVQPYRVALNSGVAPIKRGRGALVFESGRNQKIRVTNTNGRKGSNDGVTLPAAALNIPDSTGVLTWDYSQAGLNVMEGEVCLRGTDSALPDATSQAFEIQHLNLVGVRSTNDVVAAPGLVLDHAWGIANDGNGSRTVLAGNAYAGECLNESTNAYLTVRNGSTLDAGTLEVGIVSDASKAAVAVRPRVTIADSVCAVANSLVLSGRADCEAFWTVTNGALYAGADAIGWNGAVRGVVDGVSTLAKNAAGEPTVFAACAEASGELVFGTGSICRASGSTAAEGAAASVAFDGGSLVVPDGTTIDFAAGCGLKANAGGLGMDVPAGETWTLASSVDGPGAVILRGEGTLALSGTISAAFAGSGTIAGGALKKAELRPTVEADGTVTEMPLLDGVAFAGKVTVDLGHGADDPLVLSDLVGKTVARYAGTAPDVRRLKLSGVNGGKVYGTFAAEDGKLVLTGASDSIGLMLIVR